MKTAHIPVIRNSYLNLFREVADSNSCRNHVSQRQLNLPNNLENKPGSYVSLREALLFAQHAAGHDDIEAFALAVGGRLQISSFDSPLCDLLMASTTLGMALDQFVRLADRECSEVHYELLQQGDEIHIRSVSGYAWQSDAEYFGEWIQIMSLLAVVRHFAGDSWSPSTILLQRDGEVGQCIAEEFPLTQIRAGQAVTGMTFPASLLRLSTISNSLREKPVEIDRSQYTESGGVTWNFPNSLKEIIKSYLDDGYPHINFAANIVGCSVRTLQRRLKICDLSYTDVVNQARFEIASTMLSNPSTKVIDAAYAVGYEDPAHFTRAFRRITGVTPNEYRKLNYLH